MIDYFVTFADLLDDFSEFISDLLPQICSCPCFIFIGCICAAIGVVKLTWYLMDL